MSLPSTPHAVNIACVQAAISGPANDSIAVYPDSVSTPQLKVDVPIVAAIGIASPVVLQSSPVHSNPEHLRGVRVFSDADVYIDFTQIENRNSIVTTDMKAMFQLINTLRIFAILDLIIGFIPLIGIPCILKSLGFYLYLSFFKPFIFLILSALCICIVLVLSTLMLCNKHLVKKTMFIYCLVCIAQLYVLYLYSYIYVKLKTKYRTIEPAYFKSLFESREWGYSWCSCY